MYDAGNDFQFDYMQKVNCPIKQQIVELYSSTS